MKVMQYALMQDGVELGVDRPHKHSEAIVLAKRMACPSNTPVEIYALRKNERGDMWWGTHSMVRPCGYYCAHGGRS